MADTTNLHSVDGSRCDECGATEPHFHNWDLPVWHDVAAMEAEAVSA